MLNSIESTVLSSYAVPDPYDFVLLSELFTSRLLLNVCGPDELDYVLSILLILDPLPSKFSGVPYTISSSLSSV